MENITLVKDTIHNPDEPRHFMELTHPAGTYRASVGNIILAVSSRVLKLSEVGHHIYDPVVYFPRSDVNANVLQDSEKTSHCPLKGDTKYYSFVDGDLELSNVAWCYAETFEFSRALDNFIAFDTNLVAVTKDT